MLNATKNINAIAASSRSLSLDDSNPRSPIRLVGLVRVNPLVIVVLLMLSICVPPASAYSGDDIEDTPINEGGSLELRSDYAPATEALTLRSHANFEITGLTARVEVTQYFKNDGADWVEGIYRFPLPPNSAVDHLKMIIGDRVIEGEIQPKKKAKAIYRKAKNSGQKASLVEQLRPNMFSSRVANIAPYETIKIVIGYQQVVHFDVKTGFSLRFPLAITPRYTPLLFADADSETLSDDFSNRPKGMASDSPRYNSEQMNGYYYRSTDSASNLNNSFSFNLNLHAGFALNHFETKGYPAHLEQKDETEYGASLLKDAALANGDLVIKWQAVANSQPQTAIFSEKNEKGQFVSLMLMPPQQGFAQKLDMPRQLIFVIDTSGSMGGESIRQAKQALQKGLDTLATDDWFNIIEFNSDYSMLFTAPRPVNDSNIASGRAFVRSLNANGGTEMAPAMESALNQKAKIPNNQSLVKQVIFLTDGAIGNESQLFKLIENNLSATRLYTVGIGSAPNSFFMERAAEYGRGSYTYIDNISQAGKKMEALFNRISAPQLSSINIQWPSSAKADMWPRRIPDLYAGQPLWLTAKVNSLAGRLTISGQLLNTRWQNSLPLNQSEPQQGIASLWAREKIGSILRASNYGQLNDLQEKEVVDTAMKFHLVSPLTSLVAVDKTPSRTNEQLKQIRAKENLPRGMKPNVLPMPATGLNLKQQFLLGLLLMLLSVLYLRVELRREIKAGRNSVDQLRNNSDKNRES